MDLVSNKWWGSRCEKAGSGGTVWAGEAGPLLGLFDYRQISPLIKRWWKSGFCVKL